jgi:hypothetical protein
MYAYVETYGEDEDGRRGDSCWSYVLEEEDREYIREYVQENMPEYFDGDGSGTIAIPFINPITEEDVDIEVILSEWL